MKDLLIYHHLGCGDHLICNGLVRHFAKFEPKRIIHVPCKTHNVPSVKWMFSDVPNIVVDQFADDSAVERMALELEDDVGAEIMRLTASGHGFDKQFYDAAGVPFEERWSGFHVERCPDEHAFLRGEYTFVHDDPERGFVIPHSAIRTNWVTHGSARHPGDTIWKWRSVLEQASAIHCIPSAFSVLLDSLPALREQKLFLHVSARPGCELPTYRKDWKHV